METGPSVYDYEVPSKFLEAMLSSKDFGRGSRSKLAEHLGVQGSFISQVLSEKTALNVITHEIKPEHSHNKRKKNVRFYHIRSR